MRLHSTLFFILGILSFQSTFLSAQTTYTVCATGCHFTTLQIAIDSSMVLAGDTLSITDSIHTEKGIVVRKNLTIQSGRPGGSIVQAHTSLSGSNNRVFWIPGGFTATMKDLTIRHGVITGLQCRGGGLVNSGQLDLFDCIITTNLSYDRFPYGGGIANDAGAQLNMTNCTVSGNTASTPGNTVQTEARGGGIENKGTIVMTNCTIANNTVQATTFAISHWATSHAYGGGIRNQSGTISMTNCTISENTCAAPATSPTGQTTYSYAYGGGIYSSGGTLNLTNCTVGNNSSDTLFASVVMDSYGGGIHLQGATLHSTNSIFTNNRSINNPNLNGNPTTNIQNICEDCPGTWHSTFDPVLDSLDFNGGVTATMAIASLCSPAINAGNPTGAPTLDQTGQSRLNTLDIGAYEYQEPLLEVARLSVPGIGAGTALAFNGADSYIDCGDLLTPSYTKEAWIYMTNAGLFNNIISGGAAGEHAFWAPSSYGNRLSAGHNGTWNQVQDPTALVANTWYHVAVTYDAVLDSMKLYKNGLLVDKAGNISDFEDGNEVYIAAYDGAGLFGGQIDEVRIWETPLSQLEIRDWMCRKVENTHYQICNLTAYYCIDEGSGTVLTDIWGAFNGTFVGSPSYVYSGAALGDRSAYDYNGNATSITETHADGSFFSIDNFTGTPDGAHVYLVNEAPNSNVHELNGSLEESRYYGVFMVGGATPSYTATYDYGNNNLIAGTSNEAATKLQKRTNNAATNWENISGNCELDTNSDSIKVEGLSGSGEYLAGFGSVQNVERPGSGYALDFNGTFQYVSVPYNDDFDLGNTFTFETWVKASALPPTIAGIISLPASTTATGARLEIRNNGQIGFGTSGLYMSSDENIELNKWTHLAGTYDGTAFRLYKNGVLIGTVSNNTYTTSSYTEPLFIGKEGSGGVLESRRFTGQIDEVRIWDIALSAAEIQAGMCQKIKTDNPDYCDLVSQYSFDENTGTTLIDNIRRHNGTILVPTYRMSGAPIGDGSNYLQGTLGVGDSVNLAHANGDQMTMKITQGSAKLIQLYRVDEAPNFLVPPAGLDLVSQINHWGAKIFGGSSDCEYQIVYNYDGHPGVNEPNGLRLLSRANNAAGNWIETPAVLDETQNTFTLGGQTGTQFVLGSGSGNSLPVELLYFDAQAFADLVQLDWQTSSEINHDYFEIQRSTNGKNWRSIERVNGVGSPNSEATYTHYDKQPLDGKSYYRLRQVDVDGQFSFSEIQVVTFAAFDREEILVFPNPARREVFVRVNTKGTAAVQLRLLNLQGQVVREMEENWTEGANELGISLDGLAMGVYYVVVRKGALVFTEKVLVVE